MTRSVGRIWTRDEARLLRSWRTPRDIQDFLDEIAYSDEPVYRCPRQVIADRKAHCLDGALLAAAALAEQGHPALVVDLMAVRDDDHVIAIFYRGAGRHRRLGAVAKSNVVGLRYREPVYRSLRELVMSMFELYYNLEGEKTLRSFSRPIDLAALDHLEWRTSDRGLEALVERLERASHAPLLNSGQIRRLSRVDSRLFEAGLAGANPAGLYRPGAR